MSDLNRLQTAVINQLGYDELSDECKEVLTDICNYGIDGGFGQFVYYSDTSKFAVDNLDEIKFMLHHYSESMGVSSIELVQGIPCLNNDYTLDEIAEVLYAGGDDRYILNSLAWFAAEEIARELIDY